MQPLISVIVPVYNVEPYLDQCVESIVNQTYKNLEIILVDDGSPDNCPAMCDKWAEIDSRIIVIHKENGGLSDARNAGLRIASGEYIGFVDSDDWVANDFFEKLYEPCKVYGCEISACDVEFTESRDVHTNKTEAAEYRIGSPEDALYDLIRGVGYRAVVWNKLYASHLLSNETFPVGKYHEDEFFTYRIISKAKVLSYTHISMYNYFQNSDGIMRSLSDKHVDALEAYIARLEFFKVHFPNIYIKDKISICKACIGFYNFAKQLPQSESRTAKQLVKYYRSIIKFKHNELSNYSIKDYMYIFATKYTMPIISAYFKQRNIKSQ